MSVQGGNTIDHGFAYSGMVADLQLVNGVSKLNKGTEGTSIAFGKGVVTDGEDGAKLPIPTSDSPDFVGVVKYELNRAHLDTDVNGGAIAKQTMTVVTFGVIWVVAAETVVKDDLVFLRVGATNQGDFATSAGSGATLSVAILNARFLTAGDTGDLVKISLGLGG